MNEIAQMHSWPTLDQRVAYFGQRRRFGYWSLPIAVVPFEFVSGPY